MYEVDLSVCVSGRPWAFRFSIKDIFSSILSSPIFLGPNGLSIWVEWINIKIEENGHFLRILPKLGLWIFWSSRNIFKWRLTISMKHVICVFDSTICSILLHSLPRVPDCPKKKYQCTALWGSCNMCEKEVNFGNLFLCQCSPKTYEFLYGAFVIRRWKKLAWVGGLEQKTWRGCFAQKNGCKKIVLMDAMVFVFLTFVKNTS